MNDLHAHPPFAATSTAHLIGGPLCGDTMIIPIHCGQIDLEDGTSYQFCSFASATFERDTFIHSTLDPLLYAR